MRADLKPYKGSPTLHINGAPHPCTLYMTWFPRDEYLRDFAGAGFKLFAFDTTCGCHYYRICQQVWDGPGQYNFQELDERIERLIGHCPDALLMPLVYIGSPAWWDEAHPSELMRDHRGELVKEKKDYGFLAGQDPGMGPEKPYVPSFSSKKWLADAGEALRAYLRHVEEKFGDRVVGYLLESGGTEEWYYWCVFHGVATDYSAPQQEGFAASARAQGQDAQAIPGLEARRATATGGFFRDAEKEKAAIAYTHYHNDAMAGALLHFARIVKDETRGEKICGAFYGYAFDLERAKHVWPESGHLALQKVLDAPEIDFLTSPTSYLDRRIGEGLSLLGGPHTSLANHGKFWFNQNDLYTHLTPKTGSSFYRRAENREESVRVHRREVAQSICNGVPMWWFDMHGGWFAKDELMPEVARMREVLDAALETDRTSVAEVALVVDYRSPAYTESDNRLYESLLRETARQLTKTGAPFDVLLLSDLERARGDYRFYLFANALAPTAEERALLRARTRQPGVTSLWLYAAGYGAGGGLAGVEALTGVPARLRAPGGTLAAKTASGLAYGPGLALAPQLAVNPAGGDVLAAYADAPNDAALLRATYPEGGSSVLAAVPGLPAALLRELFRGAGVHVYTEAPGQVWANRDWLGFCARESGPAELRLRTPDRLREVFSGETFVSDAEGRVALEMRKDDVYLWRVEASAPGA
ncbi:MAG: hypothetical protein KIS92_16490 [Planctomycetota bacterium]|nr:hypothetical protein [Planctomycetota bacterium]